MLPIHFIRENQQQVIAALKKRNFNAEELLEQVIKADEARRNTQQELDNSLAEANAAAKQIGELFKVGKQQEANALKDKTAQLKEKNKALTEKLKQAEEKMQGLLYDIPNIPHESVPSGKSSEDNEIVFESEKKPAEAQGIPHWELAAKYDIIDFEAGVKVTGAGFPVYKGKGARLQRALVNFFIDEATDAGYTEVQPPLMVNAESGYGTGQLPDKEGQMYEIPADGLYLIPTAEVPITNLLRDTMLSEDDFPVKMTGYTPCFRREAGSYGKDVRGLNRLHQFDKVEIVQVTLPDNSYQTLDGMVEYVKSLLKKLELPYRVAKLCGGDLGFTSALTYDMEVFSSAQQKWLEVSSVSNFESFQANRLKLRYKNQDGKSQLAHTLNGSALALPRILAALLENNQTENGIKIPDILVKYTGFDIIN